MISISFKIRSNKYFHNKGEEVATRIHTCNSLQDEWMEYNCKFVIGCNLQVDMKTTLCFSVYWRNDADSQWHKVRGRS